MVNYPCFDRTLKKTLKFLNWATTIQVDKRKILSSRLYSG